MECLHPQRGTKINDGTKYHYGYRCGVCVSCRIERREQWAARILLECMLHSNNVFVTLTYDEEHRPEDGSVSKRELQLFLKRFRKVHAPFRYFAVGEYGERTRRPHYHAILFGVSSISKPYIDLAWSRDSSSLGWTHVVPVAIQHARYIARYTVKKMTQEGCYEDGRHPEFSLMSRKPGVGANVICKLLETTEEKGLRMKNWKDGFETRNEIEVPRGS